MEDNYAPIVLFVYNRPEHTKHILKSLNRLEEAKQSEFFIYSDGGNEKTEVEVSQVRDVLKSFQNASNFAKLTIVESDTNQGLAKSIISGVTDVINKYDKIIVLEDDLIVSGDFLTYMNNALKYYKNEGSVWAISAYTFPMKSLENYKHDIYFSGRGCSWGWATWKDRWETVDWEVSNYPSLKYDLSFRQKFAKWGNDLPCMLDSYAYHEIHSWAIRWCLSGFLQNKYTVYPKLSRILNKGTDGTGTNYNGKIVNTFDTVISDNNSSCLFEILEPDKKIQKEFASKYVSGFNRLKLETRWLLIKLGLIKPSSK